MRATCTAPWPASDHARLAWSVEKTIDGPVILGERAIWPGTGRDSDATWLGVRVVWLGVKWETVGGMRPWL